MFYLNDINDGLGVRSILYFIDYNGKPGGSGGARL